MSEKYVLITNSGYNYMMMMMAENSYRSNGNH